MNESLAAESCAALGRFGRPAGPGDPGAETIPTAAAAARTLGVLGHVDHGKTALVRALTGIETDRLAEERERGLSIVLGFSYLETAHGIIDLVDVPGHESFVRAMISGATGLDGAVLVVAANEGVMPQTREHLEIASLLGIRRGVIVLTKVDLVDTAALERARAAVSDLVRGTFLAEAAVAAVSAVCGDGIEELARLLGELSSVPPAPGPDRGCHLPLDRVFTKRGFGVVGTGTLRGGVLRVGDALEILPAGAMTSVRALQSRNRSVEAALPGQRVAVNLRGVDLADVRRGDTLATPGRLAATQHIDVRLELLERAATPLGNGGLVRLLLGTTEVSAKVRLLDAAEAVPGAETFAQLRLARTIVTLASERFILRSPSPPRTIGGGTVLDPHPARHRRFDKAVIDRLAAIASGDPLALAARLLEQAGSGGIEDNVLRKQSGLVSESVGDLAAVLDAVPVESSLGEGRRFVARSRYGEVVEAVTAAVERYHAEEPESAGIASSRLRTRLNPRPDEAVFRAALHELIGAGRLARRGAQVALPGFDPIGRLDARGLSLANRLEAEFLASGLKAPKLDEMVGSETGRRRALKVLLETGRLVRLRTYDRETALVLHAETLERVRRELARAYPHPARFAVKDVRDLLGSTRRHIVPIMEHFDATGVTARAGDLRRLRQP